MVNIIKEAYGRRDHSNAFLAAAVSIGFLQIVGIQTALAATSNPPAFSITTGTPAPVNNANAAKAQAPAAPAVSTASVIAEPTIQELYPIEKLHLRDPFVPSSGGSSGYSGGGELTEFSIHNLVLKGIMQDPSGDFALFVDSSSGLDYVLRKNTLYDNKNKPVSGVSGIIKPQQKIVHLLTSDQDVQTFVLGEEGGPE